MNCQQCQRHLLACERLDSRPPEVAGHLAGCPSCRQWEKRLAQIESQVPMLPLAVSQGKEQFVRRFLHDDPVLRREPDRKWFPRSRLGMAMAAAAAILLVAGGIMLIHGLTRSERGPLAHTEPKRPRVNDRTLAGKLLELDMRLAEADSPRQRVETLAQVADHLHGESRALAAVGGPKDLDALARLYDLVVRDGIVARARHVPAGDRHAVLDPIAAQLSRARKTSEDLAARAGPAAAPLLVIAAAARTGDRKLRDLIKEAMP